MPFDHHIVERVVRDDGVDPDRAVEARLLLTHGANTLQHLLVVLKVPPHAKIDEDVGDVLQTVDPVPHALRVRDSATRLARTEHLHPLGRRDVDEPVERLQDALAVALELVRDQHRHARGLGHDAVERFELRLVNWRPGGVVRVDRPVRHLAALVGERRSVERLDRRAAGQLGEHVALELLVQLARGRRQGDPDRADDGLLEVEPVLRADRDRDVVDARVDLLLGVGVVRHVAVEVGLEPPVHERRVAVSEALTEVEEPVLAPQVLEPVRGRGAGQVNPPIGLLRHLAERPGALPALPGAEPLQPGGLVRDDGAEGPRASLEELHEPRQLLVVRGVDLARGEQRRAPLLHVADHRVDVEVLEVVPLLRLGRPRLCSHPLRAQHEHRVRHAHHDQRVDQRERADRLADAHAGEPRRALHVEREVDHQLLVLVRDERFAHGRHSMYARITSAATCGTMALP